MMLRFLVHFSFCAWVLLLAPLAAIAQNVPATNAPKAAILVADSVFLNGSDQLIAQGHVEALYDQSRLKAARIVYDRTTDTMQITGPITITQGDETVILADAAQLDRALENGLLTGARMVMNQQVQLAAQQINRVNGRYSQLYKAAVTSCRVCNAATPPLWQIRARSIVHDQVEKQLYFEGAILQVKNVPIFYLPRLRLPDPSLDRATGFLIPSVKRNSLLGTGVKIPYFFRIGDHKDLTLTPYLSAQTRTIELRYRQAFYNGEIIFEGALTQDTLRPNAVRAYTNTVGTFDLRRDFKLTFDIEATADNAYLADYGYSQKDRLDSELAITRARRDEFIRAALLQYHSLRVTENNATLPTLITDLQYERRFFPAALGGELRMATNAHAHFRYSKLSTDGPDSNPWADGLDVTRLNAEISWRRNWTLLGGLRAGVITGLAIDSFHINQAGITAVANATQITPSVAVSLRYPLRKTTARGATHIIEPMVQLAWAGGTNANVPNDESTRVEFDEGNLLSLSRFPAPDRRERGLSAALGASWTRIDPNGWQAGVTVGQVIRKTAVPEFTTTSGLNGTVSKLLVAGYFRSKDGLSLTARGVLDNSLDVSKAEARAGWQTSKFDFGASYVWLGVDAQEDRLATQSEWSLDGSYRLSRHWTGFANWRYDIASNRAAEAGLGLQYRNECVDLNLSVSRRFTSSIILTPSTDFSFTIGLRGFSAKTSDKSYARTCSN